jgi:protein-tyrosine-phosphatase
MVKTKEANKYLFVCMGNVDRSITGERVFKQMLEKQGYKVGSLEDEAANSEDFDFIVDSAGIAPKHGKRTFERSMAEGARCIFAADHVVAWYLICTDGYNLQDSVKIKNLQIQDQYDVSIDWERKQLENMMKWMLSGYVPRKKKE